jgi:hypothetical protein
VAITQAYGPDEAIALAIEAGVDLLLFANQQVYDEQVVEHAIATIVELVDTGRIGEARSTIRSPASRLPSRRWSSAQSAAAPAATGRSATSSRRASA